MGDSSLLQDFSFTKDWEKLDSKTKTKFLKDSGISSEFAAKVKWQQLKSIKDSENDIDKAHR